MKKLMASAILLTTIIGGMATSASAAVGANCVWDHTYSNNYRCVSTDCGPWNPFNNGPTEVFDAYRVYRCSSDYGNYYQTEMSTESNGCC